MIITLAVSVFLVFPNTLKVPLSDAPLSTPEIAAHYGFERGWWEQ